MRGVVSGVVPAVAEIGDPRVDPGSVLVSVDSYLLQAGAGTEPAARGVLGGAFSGWIAAVGRESDAGRIGERVVGYVRHGACAEFVAAPSAAVFGIARSNADHAVIAALPGERAMFAVARAKRLGATSLVVLSPATDIGCLVGALSAEAGIRAIAVSSDAHHAALSACGFADTVSKQAFGHDGLAAAGLGSAPALVDCWPDARTHLIDALGIDAPVITFGRAERLDPASGGFNVNLIDEALHDDDVVQQQFSSLLARLSEDRLAIPTTRIALDDVPAYARQLADEAVVGAVVVNP